ncbi:FAD-depending monooxygenase [Planoprotostelium fungivorum]|uniref:FAD-depending monooxygenase n=1 Tax=Planoprotostelium fungivorum TaxID=1890364 RepID=A0A2P6NYX8_9EUKA|nr:FAD-depending monooxygenase [Planoprotostelium fungivorum]
MTEKVIIIGAGLGGLALARGLKTSNIPFTIYESDVKNCELTDYRISVNSIGGHALKELLSQDLFDIFQLTSAIPLNRFLVVDGQLNTLLESKMERRMDVPPEGCDRAMSRLLLRQLLLEGLEDDIHFDRTYDHHVEDEDGLITVHLTDGTTDRCLMLVGADGIISSVRKQILPHARLYDTKMIVISGRCRDGASVGTLHDDSVAHLHGPNGSGGVIYNARYTPMEEILRQLDDTQRSKFSGDPQSLLPRCRSMMIDGRYWNLWFTSEKLPEKFVRLEGSEMLPIAIDVTKQTGYSTSIIDMIEDSDPHSVFSTPEWSCVPMDPWEPTAATLLGDAVHATSRFEANTTLRDAVVLCEAIRDVWDDATSPSTSPSDRKRTIRTAVGLYERQMREYAYPLVIASRSDNGMSSVQRSPTASWLTDLMFRASLKLFNLILPVRNLSSWMDHTAGTQREKRE